MFEVRIGELRFDALELALVGRAVDHALVQVGLQEPLAPGLEVLDTPPGELAPPVDGTYSLGFANSNPSYSYVWSRDSSNPPVLEMTYEP